MASIWAVVPAAGRGSHFGGEQQAFFAFEIRTDRVLVREYKTNDAWKTGSWTPKSWTAPLPAAT
jgi:hypothetical protein